MDFRKRLLEAKPLIMDGAMGSMLFERIPAYKGSFELLNIENPGVIADVHKLYVDAGADILETNTFGGNALKLAEYGLEKRCREINRAGVEVAKKAAGDKAMVGASTSATGQLVAPMGEASYDQVFDAYKEQMIGFEEGGADLIIIETMSDLQEAKIAIHAAKEFTKLPILASMTFEASGKCVTGTDIVTAFASMAGFGADAVAANCSLGPDKLYTLFSERIDQLNALGVPLGVWSNAGLPVVINGKTCYPLSPDEFAVKSRSFAEIGFKIIGGCCGTNPNHIKRLRDEIDSLTYTEKKFSKKFVFATSRYRSVDLSEKKEFVKIGERLNPTARKKFREELLAGDTNFLREEAKSQIKEGADILDINVGVPSLDEIKAIKESVHILSNIASIPLMIDSDNADVIEEALKLYPGIPVVNSINGKEKSIKTILPLIQKYGCFIVALCLDDTGIHQSAEKRIEIGEKLVKKLAENGITEERIIIDPLMLAESAEPGSATETLKVIEHFANRGIKTSLGISNVSFGLPERKHINNAFLKLAIAKGLTAGIINTKSVDTSSVFTDEEKLAIEFIEGRDRNAAEYIAHFAKAKGEIKESPAKEKRDIPILESVRNAVIEGDDDTIESLINSALNNHNAESVMNDALIKGLERVGELYSSGEYFLPQMISSANVMKKGFNILKPILAQGAESKKGRIVICTVKGDIHDIGKNIVAMMLENHGFEIYDMGKDIETSLVIDKAVEVDADLVCLSSLLTTTMPEMKVASEMIAEKKIKAKLMVGGAVVTEEYAQSINAHYSEDAVGAVNLAKRLLGL